MTSSAKVWGSRHTSPYISRLISSRKPIIWGTFTTDRHQSKIHILLITKAHFENKTIYTWKLYSPNKNNTKNANAGQNWCKDHQLELGVGRYSKILLQELSWRELYWQARRNYNLKTAAARIMLTRWSTGIWLISGTHSGLAEPIWESEVAVCPLPTSSPTKRSHPTNHSTTRSTHNLTNWLTSPSSALN